VLSTLLVVGFLLPTDWEADAAMTVRASPAAVFRHLDSPEGWRRWTPWPDSGLVREGPARGSGATVHWDDPELGAGSFRLVDVAAGERVRYEVTVDGGRMKTEGEIVVTADGAAAHVRWRERGNLGRNPLMGYWALSMERAQTAELMKALERLAALAVEEGGVDGRGDARSSGVPPIGPGPTAR
jgi:uncharacterized protein YndB with AHSA1/START domain